MTRDDQMRLMEQLCNRMRDNLLKYSGEWPEDWNGVELRWLILKTAEFEQQGHEKRSERWRTFRNNWIIKRLY